MYSSIISFLFSSRVVKQSLIPIETALADVLVLKLVFIEIFWERIEGSLFQFFNYLLRH